jgi:hypothetical protein
LDLDGSANPGADLNWFEVKIGKRTNIYEIETGVAAQFFKRRNEDSVPAGREFATPRLSSIRTSYNLKSDVFVSLGVLISDSARSENSDSHER